MDKFPLRKKPTRKGQIRLIHIDDFDYVACGGTHVGATGQIQMIKIIATEKIRGRVAVKFLCGNQAVADYQQRFEVTSTLTKELTCGIEELPIRLLKLTEESKLNKIELTRLRKELMPVKAENLLKEKEVYNNISTIFSIETEGDEKMIGPFASLLADKINGLAILQSESRLVIAVSADCKIAANDIAKMLSEKYNLKGGGNKQLAQLGGTKISEFKAIKESIIESLTHE